MQKTIIVLLSSLFASIAHAETTEQIPDYEIINKQGRTLQIALPKEYDEGKVQLLAEQACNQSKLKVCAVTAWIGKEQTPTVFPPTDAQKKSMYVKAFRSKFGKPFQVLLCKNQTEKTPAFKKCYIK